MKMHELINETNIEWKEEYGIGVEGIDSDHQELFRIVRRLFIANQQPNRTQWAAEEGIKYLRMYTIKHFDKEEKFMREIAYRDIKRHLVQHRIFRDKVVPRMESYLHHSRFSREAMDKFLDIMRMWLERHILIHDRALGWTSQTPAEM